MQTPSLRARSLLAVASLTTAALAAAGLTAAPTAHADAGACGVQYRIDNDWSTGATVSIVITNNTPTAINGWTLAWTFPGDQTITDIWNATRTQNGATVTATNLSYNAGIPASGGTAGLGLNISYTGANAIPTAFTLNGVSCGQPLPPASPSPSPSANPVPSPSGPAAPGNLALRRPVSTSSDENPGLAGAQAVDGNPGTRWSSAYSDPQWIQVDLSAVIPIRHVRLRWETAYARGYRLQSSADGSTWTDLYETAAGDGGTDDIPVTGEARYVRMYGFARGTGWGYSLYEFEVYAVPPTPDPVPTCGQAPADPAADSKARNLLCYLRTHAYISGQTDLPDAERVQTLTGRYPAIVAFDFMEYTRGAIDTQRVIDWYNARHGIVAFQWHWYCPRGGNYSAPCDFVPDLSNPSSKLYQDIDLVVRELKKMGDAGIPVLFRPLHESNNNYMWWTKKGTDAYKQLWRLIYQRAQAAGVHNVLWVFNGMAAGQSTQLSSWYPGDAYADLVTSDYYQSSGDFATCRNVGTGKTVGVAETFSPLNPATESAWPYFVVWASRDWASSGKDVPTLWRNAMADPRTITIDQLPDMTRW